SITIIEALVKAGAKVQAHDPAANENIKGYFRIKPLLSSPKGRKKLTSSLTLFESSYKALEKSDGLILVTEWNEFRRPDFDKMKSLMRRCVIFDGRNIYNPRTVRAKGFTYYGVGR